MNAPFPFDEYVEPKPYFHVGLQRHCVVLYGADGNWFKRMNMSYARYLMCVELGRILNADEVVHHVDGNRTNDVVANLEVMPRKTHDKHHSKYQDTQTATCVHCKQTFIMTRDQIRQRTQNTKRGMAGPFCSVQCFGKSRRKEVTT